MAFDVSALSAWTEERGKNKADWILKPILGGYAMKYLTSKYYGIQGNTVKLPKIDTTVPAQGGYGCGFTSSGTTDITQLSVTTVPYTVQEKICVRDLHQYFTVQTLPEQSMLDTWSMLDVWVNRKLQRVSQKLNMALWQGKTTYTNDTWLKLQNGFINDVDGASDEIIVTGGGLGTAITTSNVRTIWEEALFNTSTGLMAVPEILDRAIAFCGQDVFTTTRLKLMQDNLYHVPIGNANSPDSAYSQWEMYYPGSTIKIVGIPELNSTNPVETGVLPTAVKNRIVICDPANLIVAMNGSGEDTKFKVWYSEDNDEIRFSLRGFVGTTISYTSQVVTY